MEKPSENIDRTYVKDAERYEAVVDELFGRNPPLTLPSEYAHFVEENTLQLLVRLARYKFVARQLKATDRVLEVGCGSGVGALFLAQHAGEVVGIDVNGGEVAEAKKINRRDNVSFMESDLFDFCPERKFDVVLSLDVIEHMPKETGSKLIGAMSKLLKNDGMLVIGSPSIYSYPFQSPQSQAGHIKCYDQAELRDLIEAHVGRTLAFSMNDEMVHTGFAKLAWYYFILGFGPRVAGSVEE